jgi:hypothetical protein
MGSVPKSEATFGVPPGGVSPQFLKMVPDLMSVGVDNCTVNDQDRHHFLELGADPGHTVRCW